MQNFRHPSALWLSAQSCGGAGNLQKDQGNLSGRADPAAGLRSGRQLCQYRKQIADAGHEYQKVKSTGGILSMKSFRKELHFHLPTRRGLVNITGDVQEAVTQSGVKEGLVLVNAMNI